MARSSPAGLPLVFVRMFLDPRDPEAVTLTVHLRVRRRLADETLKRGGRLVYASIGFRERVKVGLHEPLGARPLLDGARR